MFKVNDSNSRRQKTSNSKSTWISICSWCQLVASCDLAYSTRDTMFATPGVNIGLFCNTPMVAVEK